MLEKIPSSILLLLALLLGAGSLMAKSINFRAHLSGAAEVPAVITKATGQAIFNFRPNGLRFKVNVANIENVFAAHIHCGADGQNGPVGVTMFFAPPPNLGPVNGTLAEGIITDPLPENACGWSGLSDIMNAMFNGDAYVNVHTLPGTPSGEIRGQIR